MKQIKTLLALLLIVLTAASCTQEIATDAPQRPTDVAQLINIAPFPAFGQGAQTRAIGTPDPGKTTWENNDEVLMELTTDKSTPHYLVLTHNYGNWTTDKPIDWNDYRTTTATINAYYAPHYEWVDEDGYGYYKLTLKSGAVQGTSEYIAYTASDVTLADSITIDFADATRDYSRLRIAARPNMDISVELSDFQPATEYIGSATTYTLTADDKGNAYLYGIFGQNSDITVNIVPANGTDPIELAKKTGLNKSTAGHSYALDVLPANVMKMAVRVDATNGLGFNIPFIDMYAVTPAEITVDWGDNTPVVTVPKETELTGNDQFNHSYDAAGVYTITITSYQTDATKPQIPVFNFSLNRNTNNNVRKLISMNTPILNTKEDTFGFCFHGCTSLTFVSAGLFANNTQVEGFNSCFNGCTSLTSIPRGLFATNTLATDFSTCFFACSKLILNEAIFHSPEDKDRFAGKDVDFSYCFRNIGTDLTVEDKAKSIAPKLWEYEQGTGNWTTKNCYTNCNASNTDPAEVPVAWGGSK